MSFRNIVKREAKRRDLSAYRIAAMAEMPARTVQSYLAGTRDLSGERVARIAAALGLELRPKKRTNKGG